MMSSVYMWVEDGATLTVHIWASLLKCLDSEVLPLWFQLHSAGVISCLALTALCG